MHIQSLHHYPVKSLCGNALTAADITPQGIRGDRQWLLADPEGNMLTARKHPQMLLWQVQSHAVSGSLNVRFTDGSSIQSEPESHTEAVSVQVWKDRFTAYCGDTAADLAFSRQFGFPVRLYWLGANSSRSLKNSDTPLSFADGAPFLLTHSASLAELNRQLSEQLAMTRFRANIVIEGGSAFAEESWQHIRIGTVEFAIIDPCVRCVLTTIDPQTTAKHPQQQPLAYLAQNRRAIFGVNLRALNSGTISIGDKLTVLA